jgi:hypothetical protein
MARLTATRNFHGTSDAAFRPKNVLRDEAPAVLQVLQTRTAAA